jgi:hypothetical protein
MAKSLRQTNFESQGCVTEIVVVNSCSSNSNSNSNNNSIQFNSILYFLCAESTATRPITDTAQHRNIIIKIIIIIKYNNSP